MKVGLLLLCLLVYSVHDCVSVELKGTSCLCPGDPLLLTSYSKEEISQIMKKISALRRIDHKNITKLYTPVKAKAGNETERTNLPSSSLLISMFPFEDIAAWLSVNSITEASLQALKESVKAKVTQRTNLKNELSAYNIQFPKPTTPVPTTLASTSVATTVATSVAATEATSVATTVATSVAATEATSVESTGATSVAATEATSVAATEATSVADTGATSVAATEATSVADTGATSVAASESTSEALPTGTRRKRETVKRPDVPMIIPRLKGMGIKAGENATTLENAVSCWECQAPSRRVRKILKVTRDELVLNFNSAEFLAFKELIEAEIDLLFETAIVAEDIVVSGKKFDNSIGYYGAEVVTLYKSDAGARKKRATSDITVEVNIATKDSIAASDIDAVFDNGTLETLNLISSQPSAPTTCSITDLHYPTAILHLIGVSSTDSITVGTKVYFSCNSGHILNSTLDPEMNGYEVMCGIGGIWEAPGEWPDEVTGCVPSKICTVPDSGAIPSASGLIRLPYVAADLSGVVLEGDSVFYACQEKNATLNDGSGMGVYEAKCENGTLEPKTWPNCEIMTPCSVFPTPDALSAGSGLVLSTDKTTPLLAGEFAVYNCSDNTQITVTGKLYTLKCDKGNISAPDNWPLCTAPKACDVSAAPTPPAATFLLPNITAGIEILETEQLYYKCLADPGKTYLEGQPNNQFPVTCLPGAVWQKPAASDWPICQDTTTTTEPPTTTTPSMSKSCYCLGDIEPSSSETFLMTITTHKRILEVCRKVFVTFGTLISEVDEYNNRYLVPIKEQCGVKNPYIEEYGGLQGLNRSFTEEDTCACESPKVTGYWVTMEIISQSFSPLFAQPTSKRSRLMREHIEELMDTIYLNGRGKVNGLFNKKYVRTRVMRFDAGNTIINLEDVKFDPTIEIKQSLRVQMEVQFVGANPISLTDFNKTHFQLMGVNTTLSETPFDTGIGIKINLNCNTADNPQSLDSCPIKDPPKCLNKDFEGVPSYLTHQHVQLADDGSMLPFPHNVTVNGEIQEFALFVGETVEFVCIDPNNVRHFKTTEPDLIDNKLTVVCKPDKYYNVPKVWPICQAKCPAKKPKPGNGTKLELWTTQKEMQDHWEEEFWEDDLLYYRCIDYRNDGVVLQTFLVNPLTGGEVGDRRVTSQVFKCTDGGFYNTPVQFRNCAPKPDVCECLGELDPYQSREILELVCRNDSLTEDNYWYNWGADKEEMGLVILPNKTRCGVKKADYPSMDEKCYCFERDAQGVKNGFWHIMEVLSIPWHPDLFWPNTTLFKQRKIELERELDEMYLNSTIIHERGYVRSVVIKFKQGKYVLKHQTSTTTTTTTTSTTTTSVQLRGRRSVPDDERDYILDGTRTWREDKKYFIGAEGYWPYGEDEYSTQAWVEHQFYGDFSVLDFDNVDFEEEHLTLLEERNGQWLDSTGNLSLWLSQGCYLSEKCLVENLVGDITCSSVVINNLPAGLTNTKPKKMVPVSKEEPEKEEEYRVPVGGEVSIKCKEYYQKITLDQWDNDPNDMLMTVKCLPNFKFDLPTDDFPKCRSYCPAPRRLWNESNMANTILPLQMIYTLDSSVQMKKAMDPEVGYRKLQAPFYSGLDINVNKSDLDTEIWEGDKLFYYCVNLTLGVKKSDSREVAFTCKPDGTYAVPLDDEWPECDIKTTTAKPPIRNAVKLGIKLMDDELTNYVIWQDYLLAQSAGDIQNLFWKVTVPFSIILLLFLAGCLLFTRHDSLCCQLCNRDYEIKQMQNYGHSDYVYKE